MDVPTRSVPVSALVGGEADARRWTLAVVLGLHAIAFGILMRSPPQAGTGA